LDFRPKGDHSGRSSGKSKEGAKSKGTGNRLFRNLRNPILRFPEVREQKKEGGAGGRGYGRVGEICLGLGGILRLHLRSHKKRCLKGEC